MREYLTEEPKILDERFTGLVQTMLDIAEKGKQSIVIGQLRRPEQEERRQQQRRLQRVMQPYIDKLKITIGNTKVYVAVISLSAIEVMRRYFASFVLCIRITRRE